MFTKPEKHFELALHRLPVDYISAILNLLPKLIAPIPFFAARVL
jgi:hypothetical protein